jgi:abortive infection bacteriophage resistance protein
MGAKAITLDEQIQLLRSRGMVINNEEKAKEVLSDIGYYRLGFYWFPMEKDYSNKNNRNHLFKDTADFDDAVRLYYFDFKLRNILLKYLSRIEISFKTSLIYFVSNRYDSHPTWFVNPIIVNRSFIQNFDVEVYNSKFRKNKVIARHHKKYINDKYAPAWKTIEFMTLGGVISLYTSLNNNDLKRKIASIYNINRVEVFENYIILIRDIRNVCAHGNILYDFAPIRSIRKGPALMTDVVNNQNLRGAYKIIEYIIKQISINRYNDLRNEIRSLLEKYSDFTRVKDIIQNISGLTEKDFV